MHQFKVSTISKKDMVSSTLVSHPSRFPLPFISMTMASRHLYYTSAILLYTATATRASSPISSLSTLASSSGFVGSNFIRKKNSINQYKQLFSTTNIMSTTSSYKRAKLSHLTPSTKTIGTHSGTLWVLYMWLLNCCLYLATFLFTSYVIFFPIYTNICNFFVHIICHFPPLLLLIYYVIG